MGMGLEPEKSDSIGMGERILRDLTLSTFFGGLGGKKTVPNQSLNLGIWWFMVVSK